MGEDVVDERTGVADRGAVAGVVDRLGAGAEAGEAGAEGGEVAVGGRDQRRRPAHDVVAGEERPALRPGEAQVVGGMARRRERGQGPAGAADDRAVADRLVGGEAGVDALAAAEAARGGEARHRRAPRRGRVAVGEDRRADGVGEGARPGAVVAVGVGDEDGGHRRAGDGGEEGGAMGGIVGAGVDDGDGVVAEEVGAGAGEGHRPGVRGGDDAEAGREGLGEADGRAWVRSKGDAIALPPFLAPLRPRA